MSSLKRWDDEIDSLDRVSPNFQGTNDRISSPGSFGFRSFFCRHLKRHLFSLDFLIFREFNLYAAVVPIWLLVSLFRVRCLNSSCFLILDDDFNQVHPCIFSSLFVNWLKPGLIVFEGTLWITIELLVVKLFFVDVSCLPSLANVFVAMHKEYVGRARGHCRGWINDRS